MGIFDPIAKVQNRTTSFVLCTNFLANSIENLVQYMLILCDHGIMADSFDSEAFIKDRSWPRVVLDHL